jgi:hypothetical protein
MIKALLCTWLEYYTHTKNILKVTITYHYNLEFTITDDIFCECCT